jgi:hypothetical protein
MNLEKKEIERRWQKACAAFKQESALFQRIRRGLPSKEQRNVAQIAIYEAARNRYSAAAKFRAAEEATYISALNPISVQNDLTELVNKFIESIQGIGEGTIIFGKQALKEERQRKLYGDIDSNPQLAAIKKEAEARAARVIQAQLVQKHDDKDEIDFLEDLEAENAQALQNERNTELAQALTQTSSLKDIERALARRKKQG